MIIKDGASLQGLDIVMRPVLIAADKVWETHGQELVVTSGTNGTHSAGSLHYYGRALDFRTRFWDEDQQNIVFSELKSILPDSQFDFLLHPTHIHVEFDPK